MSSPATSEVMLRLHERLAAALLERIEKGEAKAADLAAAVRFLSDNGVRVDPGEDSVGGLKTEIEKILPFKPPSKMQEERELAD